MSDREDSPGIAENGSDHLSAEGKASSADDARSVHEEGAKRSRSRSRSHSRSRSYSRRRHSYSRSSPPEKAEELELDGLRSHSRSRRYSRRGSRSRSRSPQRSRSRSRSRSYTPRRSYSPQYSPRHSYYGGGDDREYRKGRRDYSHSRSYNRSPMSSRRRHQGNRVSSTTRRRPFSAQDRSEDNPEPSRCLGVFGLSLYTQERDLKDVLGKYGPIEDVQIVYDAQTGRSRGFAFVYFEEVDDAKAAKERCNGQEIDGRKIRVDYSITKRAHTPTPGIYMGKPTYSKYSNRNGGGGYRDGGFRGHSPYYSRGHRYSRSRSRSYSPHRYDYY